MRGSEDLTTALGLLFSENEVLLSPLLSPLPGVQSEYARREGRARARNGAPCMHAATSAVGPHALCPVPMLARPPERPRAKCPGLNAERSMSLIAQSSCPGSLLRCASRTPRTTTAASRDVACRQLLPSSQRQRPSARPSAQRRFKCLSLINRFVHHRCPHMDMWTPQPTTAVCARRR